jgi:hypothetical protein
MKSYWLLKQLVHVTDTRIFGVKHNTLICYKIKYVYKIFFLLILSRK